jgi:hypothetical protein
MREFCQDENLARRIFSMKSSRFADEQIAFALQQALPVRKSESSALNPKG